MTLWPEVSVVIPMRNRVASTAAAVRSALAQEGVSVEVIVVDDASDGEDADRINRIFGDAITLIRCDIRRGAPTARNLGVASARAAMVAFLDSDDVFLPDKLWLQRTAMQAGARGFSVTGFRTKAGRRFVLPRQATRGIAARNTFGGTSGLMVRTDMIRAEPFAPDMPAVQDWELYLRLLRLGPPAVLRQPLYVCDTSGVDRITANARRRALGHRMLQLRHFHDRTDAGRLALKVQALNRVLLADAARGGLGAVTRTRMRLCRSLLSRIA